MRLNEIGKSGIKVTPITLGTWAMGGDFWGEIDDQACVDALRAGLDRGINIIDTAPVYGSGHAEELVGRAIKGYRREEIVIATKFGVGGANWNDASRKAAFQETEDSLRRLGTDYIDLYQVHWPDPNTPVEETMEALNDLKNAGKIRAIGVSNFDVALMEKSRETARIDSVQPQYSLLVRDIEADLLPYCIEQGIGVLSYGSLGAGMLTGKYRTPPPATEIERRSMFYPFYKEPLFGKALALVEKLEALSKEIDKPVAQIALNWVIAQPGMTTALVGSKNTKQAIQNADTLTWELSGEALAFIDRALKDIYG
ncbi:MAG: aldo/keto reductase, partial [Clostridiales Family XIII bacterium]|nr:aldo/keto reductase [Clostridiales Family XIII bacterium]